MGKKYLQACANERKLLNILEFNYPKLDQYILGHLKIGYPTLDPKLGYSLS